MTREDIVAFIEQEAPDDINEILLADGFEDAFLGIAEMTWHGPLVAVYSRERAIDILASQFDGDYDEAVEYLDFNVTGAYVGERTPVFALMFSKS